MIVPIPKPSAEINEAAEQIMRALQDKGISVGYDTDDKKRTGYKFAEHELRGVPVRIGIGKRDLANGVVEVARRDTKEKTTVQIDGVVAYIDQLLKDIQQNLYDRALQFQQEKTTRVDNFDDFKSVIEQDIPGFISAHWDGTDETEQKIKELTKATIRCIPNDAPEEAGTCVLTGRPSNKRVLFAKAY
jgi:prolyl-tRNA synthetase